MTFKNFLLKDLFSFAQYEQKPWLKTIDSFIKKVLENWQLVLLVSAVFLSIDFAMGVLPDGKVIEIRLEDVLIVILGLGWLIHILFKKEHIRKNPLFYPIIFLLGFAFLTTLINWFLGYLEFLRPFFYLLKEVEYAFFFFYIFYHIKNISSAKFIVKICFALVTINIIFVFYQILAGQNYQYGEYGTAALSEWGVFPTGAFFLLFFIFLFNIFLYYFLKLDISIWKKGFLGIIAVSPVVGVIGAGSKTIFLAFIFILPFIFLLLLLKKENFIKLVLLFVVILIIISAVFAFEISRINVLGRYADITSFNNIIDNYKAGRLEIAKQNIKAAFEKDSPLLPFIGLGKGSVREAHNQYLRNFIEMGILGSVLFFILIFLIIKKSWQGFLKSKDNFSVGLSAGLLIATLAMLFVSMATEPFIVVKSSEIYWLFTAITMAVLSFQKQEKNTGFNWKSVLIHFKFIKNKPLVLIRILNGFFRKLILRQNVLRTIDLVVTYNCHYKCEYCSAFLLKKENKSVLSIEEIKNLWRQAFKLGAIHVNLTGGEPLTRDIDELCEIIRNMKPKQTLISLVTNSLLLTKDKLAKLKVAGLDTIQLSIESMNPEINDKLRGVKGSFDKTMEAFKYAKELGLTICLSAVICSDNQKEIERLLEFAEKEDVFLLLNPASSVGHWRNRAHKKMIEKDIDVFDKFMQSSHIRNDTSFNFSCKRGCPGGTERIHITAYGDVLTCPLVQVSYGNVLKEPLKNIFRRMSSLSFLKKYNRLCKQSFDKDFYETVCRPAEQINNPPLNYKDLEKQ